MNGRRPRTKSTDQILAELDALHHAGWNGLVFFVDDNFLGHKPRAKDLLRAIIAWRTRTHARMDFYTEASVNLAEDDELLSLMVEAGFRKVFVGIETPDVETLTACHKLQNTRGDLLASVHRMQAAGLEVMGGFIVGFDGDRSDIFERQFDFIQRAGIVTAMVGLLTALPGTHLHQRLAREGRLIAATSGNNVEAVCNFVPRLDRTELTEGYRRLVQRLYDPPAFYARARALLRSCRLRRATAGLGWRDYRAFVRSMWWLGICQRGRGEYWRFLAYVALRHPQQLGLAVTLAIYGHHFRIVAEGL
jgi:radical SAM superfamily enzyme YgiQ (UPF0313 family)